MTRVGIPRGLLYYYYGQVWQEFFRCLKVEVIVSGETSRETLERGGWIDEVCLPVKVAAGHACELAGRADYLFVPRVVSTAARSYSCPKIIGLPDLVRGSFPGLPPLIDVTVNLRHGWRSLWQAVVSVGRMLGYGPLRSILAWYRAVGLASGSTMRQALPAVIPKVALIGHPYLIYDRWISMDIIEKLRRMGVGVTTAEDVEDLAAVTAARRLSKPIFWHYCHRLVGAALALMYSPKPLDGMIFFSSFVCGPDSLVGEIIRWNAHYLDIPFLEVKVDEHTAHEGFITRLEAFITLLGRRSSQ